MRARGGIPVVLGLMVLFAAAFIPACGDDGGSNPADDAGAETDVVEDIAADADADGAADAEPDAAADADTDAEPDVPDAADADADADAEADDSMTTCAGGYFDPVTSLCWQDPPEDMRRMWDDAVTYCNGLSLAGYGPGSWHLPTISELRSLIRGCPVTETGGACRVTDECLLFSCWDSIYSCSSLGGPGTGGAYWPVELSGAVSAYWSSSSVADSTSNAWGVNFYNGFVLDYVKALGDLVRCVRLGP